MDGIFKGWCTLLCGQFPPEYGQRPGRPLWSVLVFAEWHNRMTPALGQCGMFLLIHSVAIF